MFTTMLHYKTHIGCSTSPAGNDYLDFGLSCVIGCVQSYRVEGFFRHDRKAPYFGKSRVAACFSITCQVRQGVPRDIFGNPVWRLFRYYLPGSYKFNSVIAITETGCDTGYLEIRCLTGLFDVIFDTVGLCLSCDTAGHGKGYKTVSSSFRCLAVYVFWLCMASLFGGLFWPF